MIARSTLLCCSMRLKYCCTNSTQLSSCRSMARWTAAMVVSSIWNLALCAAAYGAHANNATLAAIHTQRGFLLMIFFSLGNRRCLHHVILRHRRGACIVESGPGTWFLRCIAQICVSIGGTAD